VLKAPLNRNRPVSHLRARTVLISHNVLLIANLTLLCSSEETTKRMTMMNVHVPDRVSSRYRRSYTAERRRLTGHQMRRDAAAEAVSDQRHVWHWTPSVSPEWHDKPHRLSNYFTSVQFTYAPVHATKHRRSKRCGTRSTGTVHTSANARLTSVAIRIRIRDPDRHQNLIICSLTHCQPFLKISCKSFR